MPVAERDGETRMLRRGEVRAVRACEPAGRGRGAGFLSWEAMSVQERSQWGRRGASDASPGFGEAGEMNLEGEPKVSAFFFFALVVLLLGAMVVAFLCQGCAIGSDYVRTDSTVTYIGAPPPVGFGPRSL